MEKIHILPPEIVSKIAAGEVIERPASVVKELVENAIDAEAESIELCLKHAGKTLIQIKDTGTGIEPKDMEKVFIRHSTSKINSINELYNINSLGFRGEALYSISAISDVILRSKTKTSETGWEIHCRGNELLSLRPAPLFRGTEIEIKELFFNTPARKKFLKSDTAELNQILNIFIPYAVLYPEVRFLLANNGKTLFDLLPQKSYTSRISETLNLEEKHLMEIKRQYPEEETSIHAILGDINIQRGNKDLQFFFINGRPIQSRNLSFHLDQIYKLIFPEEAKPFFAIYIKIPPANVDVNVHPAKREVKIKDEYRLVSLLRCLCEQTLMSYGKAKLAKEQIFQLNRAADGTAPKGWLPPDNCKPFEHAPLLFNTESAAAHQQNTLAKMLSESYFIGTFQKKYLLFGTEKSLLVIDQHAAAERVNYEKLIQQIERKSIEIQNILTPILIKITRQEMLAWEETKDKLEELGFSTTLWDNDSIAIHSHPHLINNPEIAIRNIISDENAAGCDVHAVARRACRQSIMVGYQVKKEEAESLRKQLLECAAPFTCPHGRPTVIEIQENLLNKQFLRT
ncbi:MAG: DNA mismatch repair endonuclease MutL [Candidatus Omnitrophota bacterium]